PRSWPIHTRFRHLPAPRRPRPLSTKQYRLSCRIRREDPSRTPEDPHESAEHLSAADGREGVGDVLDLGVAALVGPHDRDEVDPAADVEQPMLVEEMQRGQRDPALLLPVDGLGGHAASPRLDLDEDQSLAVARDQVDLAGPHAIAPRQDAKPTTAEIAGGGPL